MSPSPDGRYPLYLNVTRQMHNQHLSCSALNSAGVSQDIVILAINCVIFIYFLFVILKVCLSFE